MSRVCCTLGATACARSQKALHKGAMCCGRLGQLESAQSQVARRQVLTAKLPRTVLQTVPLLATTKALLALPLAERLPLRQTTPRRACVHIRRIPNAKLRGSCNLHVAERRRATAVFRPVRAARRQLSASDGLKPHLAPIVNTRCFLHRAACAPAAATLQGPLAHQVWRPRDDRSTLAITTACYGVLGRM